MLIDPNSLTVLASDLKMGLTRQLTKHVVTRWYRAPELILIQPYTSAVDIWSLGCIFAEMLSMQEGNVPGYQDRKPLFPGGTCYPLSGEGDSIKADERLDQLNVIFSVLGTPPQDDIEVLGKANEYISSLPKYKGKPMQTIYPAAGPLAIDLLQKMLRFNPKRRLTAEEALEHDFFKGVRRKQLERSADSPLLGPSFLDSDRIDLKVLKQQTYEEMLWYKDHHDSKKPLAAKPSNSSG
jgi:mitogen-activated protein kinase 1/3